MSKLNVKEKTQKAKITERARRVSSDPIVRRFVNFMDQARFPFEPSLADYNLLALAVRIRWITCQQLVTENSIQLILRDIRSRTATLVLRREMPRELLDLFTSLSAGLPKTEDKESGLTTTPECATGVSCDSTSSTQAQPSQQTTHAVSKS